jgi:hypothetical protein
MADLASSYTAAARFGDAVALREQIVEILDGWIGAEHPQTLVNAADLARAYADAGRLDEAVALYWHVLKALTEALGEKHFICIRTLNALISTLRNAGQPDPQDVDAALEWAQHACKLTNYEDANCLGALAAAQSLAGDHASANATQERIEQLLHTEQTRVGAADNAAGDPTPEAP